MLQRTAFREAWSDLQQLPTPWQVNHQDAGTTGKDSNTVVEFGELSDEVCAEPLDSPSSKLTPLPCADNGELEDLGPLLSVDDSINPLSDISTSAEQVSHETDVTLSSTYGLSTGEIEFESLSPTQADDDATRIAPSLEKPTTTMETTLATENQPPAADHPNQAPHPFEGDDFIEEEVVAEQKEMVAAEHDLMKPATESCPAEEPVKAAENLELPTDVSIDTVVNEIESTGTLPMLPSDISFFLSQSPADGYEFREGSIEDTVAATIKDLSSELTTELADAETHEAPSCCSQQRLNETERTETSSTGEAAESCCKDACSPPSSDVCEISHDESDHAMEPLGSCPTAQAIREVTQSLSDTGKTFVLPQAETPKMESETAHTNQRQTENSLTTSDDDKDMIVVDNPIPANALRLIGSKTRKNDPKSAESEGVAFREDYQKLMHRLRGTINT